MSKNPESIKNYWDQRAKVDSSAQSTTMDIWLRQIESRVIKEAISMYSPSTVTDLGCGDGRTTISCAESFPGIRFQGFDYAESMINNAKNNALDSMANNFSFDIGDVLERPKGLVDFIFTTRCLINLSDWNSQMMALNNIRDALSPGGIYLMIENFIEGHDAFNGIREQYGLSEISVRDHNLFFESARFIDFTQKDFDILSDVNISSQYYLVSRIIYSSICATQGVQPDYDDIHHELASRLPFLGNFGPTKALILKKN